MNREAWLKAGISYLTLEFATQGYQVPENIRVTCGFPSRGALSARKRTIGQCWPTENSDANVFEILISPTVAHSIEVLAILAHEMVHAVVGLKAGHKAPFKRCATAIGLEGKMTATTYGTSFKRLAQFIVMFIGQYPHGELHGNAPGKKDGTRMLKASCDCGYTVRVTRKWIDDAGCPICPTCEKPMIEG